MVSESLVMVSNLIIKINHETTVLYYGTVEVNDIRLGSFFFINITSTQ